jgi:sugar phosphate isomerase/epimerase
MARLGSDDLVLCSGTIRAASFAHTVHAAAAAGFQGVSLYYDEYAIARAEGWTDRDLRAFLDDHGLAVAEIDGRMDWLPADQGGPSVGDVVTAAAALDARSITVIEVQGRRVGTTIPFDVAARAFAAVCDRAAEPGLLVHLEYFPWSGVPDLTTAYEIVRLADRPNGGVMVDVWHHTRGPDAGALAFAAPCSSVLAVQVSDVAVERHDDARRETLHHRVLPGEGAGDVAGLLRALRDQGCTAPIEVEVYSDELAALPPTEAAQRAGAALRKVLADAGLPFGHGAGLLEGSR